MATTHSGRGALPHRTIAPRPGELEKRPGPEQPQPPLTPLMYVDAKTYMPDYPVTVCPTCAFPYLHLMRVGAVRRRGFGVVEHHSFTEWGDGQFKWEQVPLLEDVTGNSIVLEFLCEEGHTSIVELGSDEGLLATRVTRLGDVGDARAMVWQEPDSSHATDEGER